MPLLAAVRRLRLLGTLALALPLAACGGSERLDFVVVLIDTLRADRLGAYGNQAGLTPHLDALAARGVVFRHAYAQSSWTNPSVASILTSRYQSQHGVTNVLTSLQPAESTLPEVLWLNGWKTAAFTANAGLSIEHGFSQGYEHYQAFPHDVGAGSQLHPHPVRADVVNRAALAWLDAQPPGAPFFVWLQYMEPHFPYLPPAPIPELDGAACPDPVEHGLNVPGGPAPPPEIARAIERCYDAEVAAADAAVGALLDELRRRGRLDRTVLVITSDHGEEILEHGRVGHGLTLFEEVIRVPLLVVVPWRHQRLDVEAVVRLVDLAPTLLELAGLPPPKPFEGRSFAGLLARPSLVTRLRGGGDAPPGAEPAFSQLLSSPGMREPRSGQHLMALVQGREKMIVPEGETPPRFYDLSRDVREAGGSDLPPAVRDRLQRALGVAITAASRNPTTPSEQVLDEETRRRLEMLGYVE